MENTIKLLCLLGPAVILLDLIVGLVRGKGSAGQRIKALWQQEHWLVCDWLGGLRKALSTPLFMMLIVLWWGWEAVLNICEVFLDPHVLTVLTVARSLLTAAIILGKVLGCTKYSYSQLVPAALIFALFVKIYGVCGYLPVIQAVFLMLAAKDTKLVQDLWAMLAAAFTSYAVTVGMALMGYLDIMATAEGGRVRYALGYGSYNTLGVRTAELVLIYLCLRYRRLRWWDILVAVAGMVFVVEVPNSRGSLMLMVVVLAVALLAKAAPRLAQKKWVPWAAGAAALVPAAGSYFLVWLYNSYQDQSWMKLIDRLLTGRVGFAWVQHYGFEPSFWGEKFGTLSESLLYRVDNAYVYYRFLCGPLMLALLLAGSAWLVWRMAKRGGADWILVAVVAAYLCYAVMERCFSPNLFTLLLCNVVYGLRSCSLTLAPPSATEAAATKE